MSNVGFAAVGVGARLRTLVEDLLEQHGNQIELKSVCDHNQTALEIACDTFDFQGPATTDYREAIATPGVEWVLIGSRNDLHADHCVEAFNAGKHVFCEKPLAITIDQCEAIRSAHRAAGTHFATGFVLRYAPVFVELRRQIQDGTLGKLISLEANETLRPGHGGFIMCNWRRHRKYSGPHILEKCSHDIDLIQWLVQSLPARVSAFGGCDIYTPENQETGKRLAEESGNPDLWTDWPSREDVEPFTSDKDIDDNLVAILEFRNGFRACFHQNSCDALQPRRMHVCGVEGTAEVDVRKSDLIIRRMGAAENVDLQLPQTGRGGHGGTDGLIVDDLARSMTTGQAPRVSGEEGFRSAVTCLAIDEARRTGNVVDLTPYWQRLEEA